MHHSLSNSMTSGDFVKLGYLGYNIPVNSTKSNMNSLHKVYSFITKESFYITFITGRIIA